MTMRTVLLTICLALCGVCWANPDLFLERFGYLDDHNTLPDDVSHSPEDRERAIRHFQRVAGLPVTGVLDRRTARKMNSSRCGVKDLVPPRERQSSGGPLPFYAIGTRWDNQVVTYSFVGYTNQLPRGTQRRAIYNAFSKWSAVANIDFREVSGNNADILISFGYRNHGDSYPFDGQGGTLAHAFFPGSNDISGDTHFDEDESWTMGTSEGTNLEIVAAHEFGHALGLGHSNVRGALMAPYYAGYDPNYGLANDDILAIQSVYGARRLRTTRAPTTRPRPTTPRPTASSSDTDCSLKFDDIFHGDDNRVYAVRGRQIYRFRSGANGVYRGRYIRRLFPAAPINPGAIVRFNGQVFFFKGHRYWRYTNGSKDTGYPRVIRGTTNWYRGVKSAIVKNGRIYLFKGDQTSIWSERYISPPRGYPRSTTSIFPRVPVDVEAAISYRGSSYFFKGQNYFKLDSRNRFLYKRPKASAWLRCGRVTPK